MPVAKMDNQQYLAGQYKDASNLNARIELHQRFSVNQYGWHRWIFDCFDLPSRCRILELGCGSGALWVENIDRIPSGWEVTLSDFSAGMLGEARRNLEKYRHFEFRVIDAQAIPFGCEYFDAAIANHMLYHVPDTKSAFSQIQRVLRPGGHLYASTVGERHLSEIADVLIKFDGELARWGNRTNSFTLENGEAQLSRWFAQTKLYRYEDALEVTQATPLIEYILSGRVDIVGKRRDQFKEFVARELESRGGVFHITKDSGIFVSVR